jgi:hypothetical protein
MSNDTYEMLIGKMELYRLLDTGITSRDDGKIMPAKEVFATIRKTIKSDV